MLYYEYTDYSYTPLRTTIDQTNMKQKHCNGFTTKPAIPEVYEEARKHLAHEKIERPSSMSLSFVVKHVASHNNAINIKVSST